VQAPARGCWAEIAEQRLREAPGNPCLTPVMRVRPPAPMRIVARAQSGTIDTIGIIGRIGAID
jgi:hypothetical protein